MGVLSNFGLLGGILILTGIISSGSIIGGGVHIFKHFNDYKCGHLNYGILVGIASLAILLSNIILYALRCIKKSSLVFPSLLIIGSSIYNGYLYNNLDYVCSKYYEDNTKLWNFYIYYTLSLIVIIILIITGFIWNCCKKEK